MRTGTNAAQMRRRNEKTILSLIHARPVSRAEIARITGLTRAAVTIITDELLQKGYVAERQTTSSAVGRRPVELLFNTGAVYTIGISITREGFFVGMSDFGGRLICEEEHPAVPPEEFFRQIGSVIENLIAGSSVERSKIYGIGIVTPGPVDTKNMRILNPPNFNDWHRVSLGEEMKRCTDFEILFENVSDGTALAEKYFGAAKGTDNFITLLIDDGIGSGLFLGNDLFDGISELGHTSIRFDGPLCECGNRGCLEKYASVPAVLERENIPDWRYAVDHDLLPVMEREADYLSTAIINVSNVFDLDKVILCGGVNYKPQRMISLISERICGRTLNKKRLSICPGEVSSKTLIASAVAVHGFFTA